MDGHNINHTKEDQFAALYNSYREKVINDAARYVQCRNMAQDIAQEVFARFWIKMNKHSVIEVKDEASYLLIMTRNYCFDVLRKQQLERLSKQEYTARFRDIYPPTDDPVQVREYRRLLDLAVCQLPQRQQQAFILTRGLGLNGNDAARLMNISGSTIKVHVRKAVEQVCNAIRSHLAD